MRGKKSKKENEKIWEKFIRGWGGLCERCWPVGKWDGGGGNAESISRREGGGGEG